MILNLATSVGWRRTRDFLVRLFWSLTISVSGATLSFLSTECVQFLPLSATTAFSGNFIKFKIISNFIILSIRNTKIMICILWMVAIFPAYYFYTWTSPKCNIFFKFDFYRYTFTQNDLCFAIIMYFDLMKYYLLFLKSHDWSNRPYIPGILSSW